MRNSTDIKHLLDQAKSRLGQPCDLDLLRFFRRHPRALLTSEQLAAFVAYDVQQVGRSLDTLIGAGLLTQSQNPKSGARMYVLTSGARLRIGSTLSWRSPPRQQDAEPCSRLSHGGPGRGARPKLAGSAATVARVDRGERARKTPMAERAFTKTGIKGLDAMLGGATPRGNLTLVEGAVGTGKSTLGAEFVFRGATEFHEPGLIVLFEVSPDKFIRDVARFGWDLPELERQGRLKMVFTTRSVFQQELQQADSLLLDEAGKIGARRIFIDSFGQLALGNDGSRDPRDDFHILAEGLHRENLTAMLVLEVVAQDGVRLAAPAPEEVIADTVMRLRLEPREGAVQGPAAIVKSRGHEYQMGRHSFRIVDGQGLEVYRRGQAPRDTTRELAASFDPTTRISSGIPGLDEMLSGGYFVGSTTLVVGISGVGKSVMSLHYAAEGARLGERGLMLTLDEPPAQVLRNAASIGIGLQAAIARVTLQPYYAPPQGMEIDRAFHRPNQIVREVKPTRAAIDSR